MSTPKQTPVPLPRMVGMPRLTASSTTSPAICTPVPIPVPGAQPPAVSAVTTPLQQRNPNALPTPPPQVAGKKRKSSAAVQKDDIKALMFPEDMEEIDDDDRRLTSLPMESCNQIRKKIRNWLDSGASKVGELQRMLNVSAPAYGRFMKASGTWEGEYSDTYIQASLFFKKRQILGLPIQVPKAKRPKKAAEAGPGAQDALLDTGDVTLPGEANRKVPVFDTCNDIRRKIRALLGAQGVQQAALIRALNKGLPDDGGKTINNMNMRTFMNQSGIMDGNTSTVFYAAYLFFERQRIKQGKPKSAFREGMEKAHGKDGVDVEHNHKNGIYLLGNESAHLDKYGVLQITTR